jgi:DegT/DnrJ/EryC1/StrS aminotransferase family
VIKFGLPGCGRIAKRHSDHIPVAELVAVYDVVCERADAFAARFGETAFYHLNTIQHPQRDKLAAYLDANGVKTNYPVALPFLDPYEGVCHRPEQFPNAYRRQGQILSLPMFAEITAQQLKTVVDLGPLGGMLPTASDMDAEPDADVL